MSQLDKVDQQRAQMGRFYKDYVTLSSIVGTDKDSAFNRTKISKLRDRFAEAEKKALAALTGAPTSGPDVGEWTKMRQAVRDAKTEWDRLDRDVKARELAKPIQAGGASGQDGPSSGNATGTSSNNGGGHASVKITDFKQIDDSELNTEDALQTEKLQGIIEVEQNMNELRTMYHELNVHIQDQGVGLDRAETNIDRATDHVEKGVKELKSANKMQKSGRKYMFVLLAVIAVIVIIVIIVVVVTKK